MSRRLRHALVVVACALVSATPDAAPALAQGQGVPTLVRVTVSGVVGDFQTGEPVVGAFVKVDGNVGGITSDAGTFRVELPPGTHWFEIRRMGYQPRIFDVRLEPHVLVAELRVALTQVPLDLPEVVVKADRTRLVFGDQRGFYRRQRLGLGTFLTRADIEARLPEVLTDLLRPIPGVEIYQSGIEDARIRMKSRLPSCEQEPPLVFVDGIEVWAPSVDALVPIQFVEAIEVYTSPVNLPAELARFGAGCGVIVIWTRH